ncbi:MAG: hypothetical protein V3V05_01420 [Pontiella sp.]
MSDTPKKHKWLLLSHAFNMDGRAASLTVTDKIPWLIERGIDPIILSAKTGRKDEHLEHHQILPFAPTGLRFDMRHIIKQKYDRKSLKYQLARGFWNIGLFPFYAVERMLIHLECHWSWFLPAYRKGLKLCRKKKIEVIYSSAGANSAHYAAYLIARKTGIPWIAEIHDPMIHDEWGSTKQSYWWAKKLEGIICCHASAAWWFTDNVLAQTQARHPELGERGFCILPGVGKPDFSDVTYQKGGTFILSHFGSLADTRNLADPMVALNRVLEKRPDLKGKIELHVYGAGLDSISQKVYEETGLQDSVVVHGRLEEDSVTGKSGRQQVLEAMRTSDVLLLVHGNTPFCEQYIPSKFYEYLWTKRPILAMPHRNPQLCGLLEGAGNVPVQSGDIDGLEAELLRLIEKWESTGLPDHEQVRPYSVEGTVDRILAKLEELGIWPRKNA